MPIKNKILSTPNSSKNINKPDTVTRAGITSNIKYTRGKQLVEHIPSALIPDPSNPRPGETIDDSWIINKLLLGTDESLCRISQVTGEYEIPEYAQLNLGVNDNLEESYSFLKELAYSIRTEGLIEPIEIFLADRTNDPDYFINSHLDYGYVILEGHQRRLAAMMAGVSTVTCIEITDENMLAKLKVKHRKLRRQLSENNLRKGLTVAQNFLITRELLSKAEGTSLTNKELSGIIGLNEGIASALKSICLNLSNFPPIFISNIMDNQLTFKMIRVLVAKSHDEIEIYFNEKDSNKVVKEKKVIKPRGMQGGASKKSATFKIRDPKESISLQRLLLTRFPEIEFMNDVNDFKNLETILTKIKDLALGI